MISFVLAPGVKIFATPDLLELRQVVLGHDAAAEHDDVAGAARLERIDHRREQRHVRARHDRQADRVDRLLHRRRRDHLRRLVEAGVDDLVAGVGERARDDLGATVVAVETGLGDEDAELADRSWLTSWPSQQIARDHDALDLARALVDPRDAHVAQRALDGEVAT